MVRSLSAWFALLAVASILGLAGSETHAAEADAEWIDLVPDEDLSKHWKTTGNWSVTDDGVVKLTPRPGEKGWSRWTAYLWSDKEYDDFEIEFEYKLTKGGNSGFYFNVGNKDNPVNEGTEVQIYDSANHPEDKPFNDHMSGGLIRGIPPTKNSAKPAGEWNKFEIKIEGNQCTVKLNGEVVNEVDLKEKQNTLKNPFDKGYIGFQDHGLPLELRNIRVREL